MQSFPTSAWVNMWNVEQQKMQQSLFLDFIAFIGEHLRNDNYCNPLDFNYWSYFSIPSPKKWETPWKTIVSEAQNPVKWSYPVGRTSFSCSSTSFSLLSLELGNCYPSGTPSPSNRLMGLSVSYLRNIYIYIHMCVWRTKLLNRNGHGQSGWSPVGCEGFHTDLNIPSPLPTTFSFPRILSVTHIYIDINNRGLT